MPKIPVSSSAACLVCAVPSLGGELSSCTYFFVSFLYAEQLLCASCIDAGVLIFLNEQLFLHLVSFLLVCSSYIVKHSRIMSAPPPPPAPTFAVQCTEPSCAKKRDEAEKEHKRLRATILAAQKSAVHAARRQIFASDGAHLWMNPNWEAVIACTMANAGATAPPMFFLIDKPFEYVVCAKRPTDHLHAMCMELATKLFRAAHLRSVPIRQISVDSEEAKRIHDACNRMEALHNQTTDFYWHPLYHANTNAICVMEYVVDDQYKIWAVLLFWGSNRSTCGRLTDEVP